MAQSVERGLDEGPCFRPGIGAVIAMLGWSEQAR
jgi:hypothetical protein